MMMLSSMAEVAQATRAAKVSHQPWDSAAAGWNSNAQLIREWLREATLAMLEAAHISPGARVLDIAAGAGDQTLDIAQRVGTRGYVLATDISPTILALARLNATAAGHTQVDTRVADAQSLAMAGANFDAAVSRLGLMFCRDPLAALQQARAALKRGGRFSALVFAQPQQNPCLVMSIAIARKHAGLTALSPSVFGTFSEPGTLMSLGKPELLMQLLTTAGFSQIKLHTLDAPFRVPTVKHYIDFLRTSASPLIEILAPLSATEQQEVWRDMTEQLDQFTTDSGWVGPNQLLLSEAVAP
jgi:ubiquinone/menaquinone biosynthesis C-methylase UbiE